MIEELVKEKHEQIDREETEKMFNAIHRNYRERQYMDKGRAYLQKKYVKIRQLN